MNHLKLWNSSFFPKNIFVQEKKIFFCQQEIISNLKLLDIYIVGTRTLIKNALNLADATKHAKFSLEN